MIVDLLSQKYNIFCSQKKKKNITFTHHLWYATFLTNESFFYLFLHNNEYRWSHLV